MQPIFLIGFMGSGKTTTGKQIASLMNREFIDLDEVIEKKEGMTISDIFSARGEDYFRALESECLKSLHSGLNIVVATGGGTPCFFDNMKWMNEHGVTVYLKISVPELVRRLEKEKDHRPLLQAKSNEQFRDFIEEKLNERSTYYNLSTIIVDETIAPKDVISLIDLKTSLK